LFSQGFDIDSSEESVMTQTAADRSTLGYALAHDEGEAFWIAGMLQTVKIASTDTGGRYGVIEVLVPPGLGSPWHVHTDEDEWFYVLVGNLTVYVGDSRVDLTPGGFAFGPTGVPHTFIGAGPEPTRVLVGLSPVQFEGFLRDVGHPAPARVLPPLSADAPPDPARLAAIAKWHGVIILGPPGPPPER
jgi:mannose-6-phosphate isomerase-like protein (cupin superfamily)